jgi:hypothetical protein
LLGAQYAAAEDMTAHLAAPSVRGLKRSGAACRRTRC